MVEKSLPWDDIDIGDAATYAPYSAGDWNEMYGDLFQMYEDLGIVLRSGNGLNPTLTVDDSPCVIDTGAAMVMGQYYKNDAPVSIVIPRPITNPRYDRIVLRREWATKLTRLVRSAGVEGAGVPPDLTTTIDVRWELPIATIIVPVAGAMTLVDDRTYRMFPEVTERQGGDPDNWDYPGDGTTWYKPRVVKMVCGFALLALDPANSFGVQTVMFNNVFSNDPLVLITLRAALGNDNNCVVYVYDVQPDRFSWGFENIDPASDVDFRWIHWMAIGEA
uniref:Putative structural protein n=1 Tax=viral metagenome TaxID=1070528 RepID=A0A6M3J492_9ZZZZ